MAHTQLLPGQTKCHGARSLPMVAARKRVLRVLQELENEVRSVVVAVGQQHRPDAADVGPVPSLIVAANGLVVVGHQPRASIETVRLVTSR